MMFSLFWVFALVVSFNGATAIVGGSSASLGQFPYQVALVIDRKYECGGSIVTKKHIVTSGVCVKDASPSSLTIRAGTVLRNKGGSVHSVVKIIFHEEFNWKIPVNDIAVVKVAEPFKFDKTRQPIGLYNTNEKVIPGCWAVISGWGYDRPGSPHEPETLVAAEIRVVDRSICQKSYAVFGPLRINQICAGEYGENEAVYSCPGDDGGGLVVKGRLAGIASWGFQCGVDRVPYVYTEIAPHRKWINKHTQL